VQAILLKSLNLRGLFETEPIESAYGVPDLLSRIHLDVCLEIPIRIRVHVLNSVLESIERFAPHPIVPLALSKRSAHSLCHSNLEVRNVLLSMQSKELRQELFRDGSEIVGGKMATVLKVLRHSCVQELQRDVALVVTPHERAAQGFLRLWRPSWLSTESGSP
jgi:hypothetical protein